MKLKKNPKVDLERFSKLFLLIGLVVSLLITELALERKTYETNNTEIIEHQLLDRTDEVLIPETKINVEVLKPKPSLTPEPILEKIEIIADDLDLEETVIESTETELNEAIVLNKINFEAIAEEEIIEEIVEDVPFFVIEKVPVFPGCIGNKN